MLKKTIVRLLKKMRFTKIEISWDDKINTICPFFCISSKSLLFVWSQCEDTSVSKEIGGLQKEHADTYTTKHTNMCTYLLTKHTNMCTYLLTKHTNMCTYFLTKHTNMCTYFLTKLTIEDKVRSVHIVRSPFSRLISSHQFHHDTHQEQHIGMFHLG